MMLGSVGCSLNKVRRNGSLEKSRGEDGLMLTGVRLFVTGLETNSPARWARIILSTLVKFLILYNIILTAEQELPLEYNTWLLFRQAVDVILVKSVLCSLLV